MKLKKVFNHYPLNSIINRKDQNNYDQSNKLLTNTFIFKKKTFNKIVFNFFLFLKNLNLQNNYGFSKNFSKIYMVGLGFKNFILNNNLYILVGDCNYVIFNIPDSIKIFCKKNQIYLLSNNADELFNFTYYLKNIKKLNFYKGKGVLEFKNFKFTKLKVGKKQRFA